MKKALIFLFLISILFFGIAVTLYSVFLVMPSKNTEEKIIAIKTGDGVDYVAQQLKDVGLIKSAIVFKVYLLINNKLNNIQIGEYTFKQTNALKIANTITQPKEKKQELVITLLEGWTNKDMAEYLEKQGILFKDEFIKLAENTNDWDKNKYTVLQDKPINAGLEGFLFPDTYQIFADSDAGSVIEKMLANSNVKITQEMIQKFQEKDLSVFEAITLASIVEKEAKLKKDKKIVAGIFLNRIQKGIKLESDATINYVTQKKTTRPSYSDIAVNSLYNTYKYSGLPPGPICNPGLDSLEAVANAETTEYMFFINTPANELLYSVTGEEHLAKKKQYYPD